ncbi:MAG: L,D-transpeptidase [Chloroflexaceae bacterium]|nr:L,D-transpeptidase [Chloroflexaceae bacterium]
MPYQFWVYINRQSLFPGGWMHDVGLPITHAFDLLVPTDAGEKRLIMQAFDRTVLVLDLEAREQWAVRRANLGTDAAWVAGLTPSFTPAPAAPADLYPDAPKRIEVSLDQQWLWAYQGDVLVLDAPVSTGKDRFETPRGTWRIYAKYARKTLRGTSRGETWHVPDVPSVMFYWGGFAIHGVYWHDRFGTGERYSHGCVGIAPHDAGLLFGWAPEGTLVTVR